MSERSQHPRMPILLVEPHEPFAAMMQHLLREQFHDSLDLSLARTFREAVSHLRAHQVAVILMNLSLPDSKSHDAVRALRSAAPASAFIALSSSADEATVLAALQSGVHEVIAPVPPDPHELHRMISHALARVTPPAGPSSLRFAHDLNNLITSINGFADLLLTRLAPEDPARSSAEQIHKAGIRAAALVKSLSPDPAPASPVVTPSVPVVARQDS